MPNYSRTPWWMTLVILVAMSPVLVYPFLGGPVNQDAMDKTLEWFYPAYVVASGLCAWLTYPQRPVLAWVIVTLMVLCHAGMFVLKTGAAL